MTSNLVQFELDSHETNSFLGNFAFGSDPGSWVFLFYVLFLGRFPENQDTVDQYVRHGKMESLRDLLNSAEFEAKITVKLTSKKFPAGAFYKDEINQDFFDWSLAQFGIKSAAGSQANSDRTGLHLLRLVVASPLVREIADVKLADLMNLIGVAIDDLIGTLDPRLVKALTPLFDGDWYVGSYFEAEVLDLSPLRHYIVLGESMGLSPHPLFNASYYRMQMSAEDHSVGPLRHFVASPVEMSYDPHPLFDVRFYANQVGSLSTGGAALSHYLQEGWRSGLSPHPDFILTNEIDPSGAETAPLLSYVMLPTYRSAMTRRLPARFFRMA